MLPYILTYMTFLVVVSGVTGAFAVFIMGATMTQDWVSRKTGNNVLGYIAVCIFAVMFISMVATIAYAIGQ